MPRVRSKRWCFTLNNYTPEEESALQGLVEDGGVQYLVYGREKGECLTPHLQGYFETKERIGLRKAKKLIGKRAHLEKANGSLSSNQKYCKKQGDVFESGSALPSQGQRTDLEEIRTRLDSGGTIIHDWILEFLGE
jgi:hypothetical protein